MYSGKARMQRSKLHKVFQACDRLKQNHPGYRGLRSALRPFSAPSVVTSPPTYEPPYRYFDKVLTANRGEISERVIRTCHALDIATVAVHSTVDTKANFVRAADESYCLGPATASESYMNVDVVLQAIRETGAGAVHPGYGFLSENASFCERITKETEAVFLGPSPHAILTLGDKLLSKQVAVDAGVSIIPGHEEAVETVEEALQLCNESIGYPVLLKAASGGGGKGMRECYNDKDVKESWSMAKAEAAKFFGDDRLLVEKYIERPHHIEFQVMAAPNTDGGTDVVVFPERECSIQRRNQKIIEETPSVLLTNETREAMAAQVRTLCEVVGYQSAGTVEFLVDEEQNFFFLEMNTRLQVEHPVTEAVCGVDLVKAMLSVGSGQGLPDELKPFIGKVMPANGHALEARIYAEDPLRGFLPSTGPLTKYVEPSLAANTKEEYIRVDSGVAAGQIVTQNYDPMLSKIIYKATDRTRAIEGLSKALDKYVIGGVQHNTRLVQSVLRNADFRAGKTPTSFLPTHYPDGFVGVELSDYEMEEFAAAAALIEHMSTETGQLQDCIVRIGGMFGSQVYRVVILDNDVTVEKLGVESSVIRTIGGAAASVECLPRQHIAKITFDGVERSIQILDKHLSGDITFQMYGFVSSVLIQSQREYELSRHMKEPPKVDTAGLVLSPMPGTLISYAVEPGDEVQVGQELCIVEAMKMQMQIFSPRMGTIDSCKVKVGASLKSDEIIIEFQES